MYERPTLQRLGSLRELTELGVGGSNDLLGIWLNIDIGGNPSWVDKSRTKRGSA